MQKENVGLALYCLIQDYFSELRDMQINIEHQKERDKGVIETQVEPDPNEYTILVYPEALEYTEQAFRASLALELSKIIYGLPNAKGVMRHKIAQVLLPGIQLVIAAFIAIQLAYIPVMIIDAPYKAAAYMLFLALIVAGLGRGSSCLWEKYVYKTAKRNAWAEEHLIERNLGEDLLQLHKEYHHTTSVMFADGMSMEEIEKATEEKKQSNLVG